MTVTQKADGKALWVWRLRMMLLAILPSFLSAFFFRPGKALWLLCTGIWIALFLFFYFFYYPRKYKKFSYSVTESCLVIRNGVFFTNTRAIYPENIQYVDCSASPLQQLFHLKTVVIVMAGGILHLPCLQAETADRLKDAIYSENR